MGLTEFLKDKFIFITLNLFISGFSVFLLYMVNADLYFMLFIPCVYLTGCAITLLPEFFIKKSYYITIQNILDNIDKKCLVAEVIEQPNFFEGKILYDVLKTTSKSMNDEIARYSMSTSEYREYIEMWVHEVKTPIAAAKLICENNGNTNLSAELDKIDKFVEQALYYSRSSNVEKDYVIKEVQLSGIINGIVRKNAKYLIEQKISVEVINLDHTIFTDVKWIDFILQQILDNSVKYGSDKLKIYGEQHSNSISLFFYDNGAGIPPKDIGRVFDKGFTGENGRKYGRSTGIGLYLCKKLCLKLGLGISIKSQQDAGTIIEIVFPKSSMHA